MKEPATGDAAPDEFLRPACTPYTLDAYFARRAVLESLVESLPNFSGTVLDVGCGQKPYRSLLLAPPSRASKYLGLDLEALRYNNNPEVTWDGRRIPLPNGAVDSALATEVLEHCPEPLQVMSEVARVLKPGGFFLLTVPFLWPLHDAPYDEFRYTPFSLERLLSQAGFQQISVRALGGWDASLAQMLGLWVRRRPMQEGTRRVVQRLALPVYRWLVARDAPPKNFLEGGMITGLCSTARSASRS